MHFYFTFILYPHLSSVSLVLCVHELHIITVCVHCTIDHIIYWGLKINVIKQFVAYLIKGVGTNGPAPTRPPPPDPLFPA